MQIANPAAQSIPANKSAAPRQVASVATVTERLLGLIAIVTLTWCCIQLEGGDPVVLLQPVPIALIASITLGGLVLSHGPALIARCIAVCFGAKLSGAVESEQLRSLCQRGRRLAWIGGFTQLLTGTIHILSVLDSPECIGPGIALCLAGLFWAPLIAELGFGSAEHWVTRRNPA